MTEPRERMLWAVEASTSPDEHTPPTEAQIRSRWADADAQDANEGAWLLDLLYGELASAVVGEPIRLPDGTPVWLTIPLP